MITLTPEIIELHQRLTCDGGNPTGEHGAAWMRDFRRYEAMAKHLARTMNSYTGNMEGRSTVDRMVACHFDPRLRHLPLTFWKEDE